MKAPQSPQMLPTTRSVTLHHMSEAFSPLLIFSLALNPTTEHDTDPFQFSSIPIISFLKIQFSIICTLFLCIFTFLYSACYTGVFVFPFISMDHCNKQSEYKIWYWGVQKLLNHDYFGLNRSVVMDSLRETVCVCAVCTIFIHTKLYMFITAKNVGKPTLCVCVCVCTLHSRYV